MATVNEERKEKQLIISGEQLEKAISDIAELKKSLENIGGLSGVPELQEQVNTIEANLKKINDLAVTDSVEISSVKIRLGNLEENTYTKEETDSTITTKVSEIVAGAPKDFDTLKEMSDWLTEHSDSAATMNSDIANLKTGISEHTASIEALEENLPKVFEDVTAEINEKLVPLEANIGANAEAIEALETDILSVNKKVEDLKAQGVQQTPLFAESVEWLEENGDKTKMYVLPDGYIYGYKNGVWENTVVPFVVEERLEKTIDACCDTEIVSGGNYNLLKISEVSFSSRLQDNAEEIVSSTAANAVTGWIPVEHGKYYALSILTNDKRVSMIMNDTVWLTRRIQIKMSDGSIVYHNLTSGDYSLMANDGGKRAVQIPYENASEMRIHFAFGTYDISTSEKLEAFEPMIIEGNTIAEAYDNSLNFAYISGDTEVPTEIRYILKSDNRKADKISLSPCYRNVNFGIPPFTYYHGVAESYENSVFGRTTKYADYILLWKSLIADHSAYVTETALGTASDGQTIYLYDFKPVRLTNQQKPIPKIIIIAGQHGGETCNIFGLYYFVNNLLNNWNKHSALEYLRNHVELMIVPVLNTYGFDNQYYKNANGVNINRNYDSNWEFLEDTTSLQYGGIKPFDQPETQIVRNLLLNNTDASLVIDSHVNGGGKVDDYSDINYYGISASTDSYFNRMIDAVSCNLSAISANFNNDYELNQPNTIMGFLNHTDGTGILRTWARDRNFVSVLVEGFGGFPNGTSYAPEVFKANEEIIVNWLITAINYLSK